MKMSHGRTISKKQKNFNVRLLLKPIDIEKYEFIRLGKKETWVVLMRPDDELAKKEAISAKDLSGLPILCHAV